MQDLLELNNLELEEKAIRIRTFKKTLSIELGRVFTETKVELNNYTEFKKWVSKTGYDMSSVCRQMQRYRLYLMLNSERGKETIETLPLNLVSEIFKLEKFKQEKFLELLELIEKGLCREGIEGYLEKNYTEEPLTVKGEWLNDHAEEINKGLKQLDIRALREKTGKKILGALQRLKKLISECTKLSVKTSRENIKRKIEQINYNSNILNLN
ncbi:MAG: hypothetical protein KBF12_14100 [Sebaldella sp.]|nr:hypothetical protein [Sebaldella sp.]